MGDISNKISSSVAKPAPKNNNPIKKIIIASLCKPIWLLRRKCHHCFDNKSVQVKETNPPPPPPPEITKPKTTTPTQPLTLENQNQNQNQNQNENTPNPKTSIVRHNLSLSSDGFTFPVLNTKSEDELQDLDLLPMRVMRPHQKDDEAVEVEVEATSPVSVSRSPKSAGTAEDDGASDTSSDLFEIQSLTTHLNASCREMG